MTELKIINETREKNLEHLLKKLPELGTDYEFFYQYYWKKLKSSFMKEISIDKYLKNSKLDKKIIPKLCNFEIINENNIPTIYLTDICKNKLTIEEIELLLVYILNISKIDDLSQYIIYL